MSDQVKDQIILFPVFGEVFPGVIYDVVCAQRAHKVQLARVIHSSHFSSIQFRKLDRKRPSASTRTIDQCVLARLYAPVFANPSQSDHSCLRDGCGLLESEADPFQRQGFSRSADILCETTVIEWDFSK